MEKRRPSSAVAINREEESLDVTADEDWPEVYTAKILPAEIDKFKPREHFSLIFYISPQTLYLTEKPYFMNIPVDYMQGLAQTNVTHTKKRVLITDIRGHESLFSLDKTGFEVANLSTELCYEEFEDPLAITQKYYQEVQGILLQRTGAVQVLPFDYQVRRRDPTLPVHSRGAPGRAQPFGAAHADQTKEAALRRLCYFHPKEASLFENCRVQIINVWKPLHGPLFDAPLAVCDYTTVAQTDRVPTDIVFPDYLGETYNFWPNRDHRWYFLDGQRADEVLLVKCFDSKSLEDPSIAQFAPHVSFPYLNPPPNTRLRESIEVRCFLFYAD